MTPGVSWPSLWSSAFFEFWWCFLPPGSRLVCLFPPPALSTPSSTFLHPFFHGFQCSFPQQASLLHCSAARTPKLPVPQCSAAPVTSVPTSSSVPGSALIFPSSVISSPSLLSRVSFSKTSPVHSPFWQWCIHGSSGLQACPQPSRLRACGRKSCSGLCQTRALLLLGFKPVAARGTPLISPAFFSFLFYCRGPYFFRGERTK